MDGNSAQQRSSQAEAAEEVSRATNPQLHKWAENESSFDLSQVKPHICMQDMAQFGNYIHCKTANHGMRMPANKILVKTAEGFGLEDMVVRQ